MFQMTKALFRVGSRSRGSERRGARPGSRGRPGGRAGCSGAQPGLSWCGRRRPAGATACPGCAGPTGCGAAGLQTPGCPCSHPSRRGTGSHGSQDTGSPPTCGRRAGSGGQGARPSAHARGSWEGNPSLVRRSLPEAQGGSPGEGPAASPETYVPLCTRTEDTFSW